MSGAKQAKRSSGTLQYFKKPFLKLGYLKMNKKGKIGADGTEVTLETASPLIDQETERSSLKGELDSAVNQYLDQVRGLGYKDTFSRQNSNTQSFKDDSPIYQVSSKVTKKLQKQGGNGTFKSLSKDKLTKKQSLKEASRPSAELVFKIHRRSRSIERLEHQQIIIDDPIEKTVVPNDDLLSVQFQLTDEEFSQDEVLEEDCDRNYGEAIAHDNPLYLSLQDCSSGNIASEPFYENGSFRESDCDDDHIYENVENSEHVYDIVPKRTNPDIPPKPDFLSLLAARQSEPIKKAWNPFVNSGLDDFEENPNATYSNIDISKKKTRVKLTEETKRCTNPFRTDHPIGTSEQTIVLDGSETSDLGSSGEDTLSVDDWPLPPTPSPANEELINGDSPLPPPPPEIALQQLEEEVLREEEEERLLALKKHKKEIERYYSDKSFDEQSLNESDDQIEAVNPALAHLGSSIEKEETKELKFISRKDTCESSKRQPRIIEVDADEEFDTPAIRHSVIIALKDSCSKALKPSDIKRKESLKRSESLKKSGIFKKSDSVRRDRGNIIDGSIFVDKRETSFEETKITDDEFAFVKQFSKPSLPPDRLIEISDDGTWLTKQEKMEKDLQASGSGNIDQFTGQPIPVPPPRLGKQNNDDLGGSGEILIAAPPDNFQTIDGSDGVFSASCISLHSGPSSLASTVTEQEPIEAPLLSTQVIDEENNTYNNKILSNMSESDDQEERSNTPSNLGAAIMESYERDIQKKKDSLNLPEVSLLEFGDSVKDLEQQRRSVIKQMTVKAKKKDSWIKTCRMHDSGSNDEIPIPPNRLKKKISDYEEEIQENTSNKIDENKFSIQSRTNMFNANVNNTQEENIRNSNFIDKPQRKKSKEIKTYFDTIKDNNQSEKVALYAQSKQNERKDTLVSLDFTSSSMSNVDELNSMVKEKNEINKAQNNNSIYESTPEGFGNEKNNEEDCSDFLESLNKDENWDHLKEGEVESASILDQKKQTKNYWEGRMITANVNTNMDDSDQGWETVGNVQFEAPHKDEPASIPPPPEFIAAPPPQFDNSPPESLESTENANSKSPQHYVYGLDDNTLTKNQKRVVETTAKKPATQENIIESEIREHQKREMLIRQETESLRIIPRDKGASSPASHDSDEGFVDRHPVEDSATPPLVHTPPLAPSPTDLVAPQSYSSNIRSHVDHPIFENERPSSETKIALEIRELREREEELRMIRERINSSRENILDDLDGDASSNASTRDHMDDHLTSLTTTTDEGNFSECGDPTSSEDKSSDGSNSRITSPDLHPTFHHRKSISVKPYEDIEEDQPVYTRMKKESVIEREIRMAREREEAYRREKGLLPVTSGTTSVNKSSGLSKALVVNSQKENIPDDRRNVQHRIATTRIQQEINQTSQREQELVDAGKILTLSEDTVDAKVTRMSDLAELSQSQDSLSRQRPSSSSSMNSDSSRNSSITSSITPINKRSASPLSPSYSPFSPTQFTPSPINNNSARLTRSLSTNNLSSGSPGLRAPKGLMQKFIASRGKLSTSAFGSPSSNNNTHVTPSTKLINTRPMKVESKSTLLKKESWHKQSPTNPTEVTKTPYRRVNLTAEEKIQEELKEMQRREDELRRERARCLAQSQPNLMDLDDDEEEEEQSSGGFTENMAFVSSSTYRQEANLRAAHSNPNLLDDDTDTPQTTYDKTTRRRSALIAQWENRIQQTTET